MLNEKRDKPLFAHVFHKIDSRLNICRRNGPLSRGLFFMVSLNRLIIDSVPLFFISNNEIFYCFQNHIHVFSYLLF
jgi:hypothetical protein